MVLNQSDINTKLTVRKNDQCNITRFTIYVHVKKTLFTSHLLSTNLLDMRIHTVLQSPGNFVLKCCTDDKLTLLQRRRLRNTCLRCHSSKSEMALFSRPYTVPRSPSLGCKWNLKPMLSGVRTRI